ncbi:MAG: hypothetical protein QXQ94_11315 [Candidatus Bathyarchaeia archaeon]
MSFRNFIILWIILIVSCCLLAAGVLPRLQSFKENEVKQNHFSVVWKGFQPTYSNQTPDYYICINNLKDTTLWMRIALKIQNFEDNGYWFMIGPYGSQPDGWTVENYEIGFIRIDETKGFVYSVRRVKPSSIPEGIRAETIHLVVKAFRDPAYTDLYSQDDFTVKFYFIDLTSTAIGFLDVDNFDDGTTEGWSGGYYKVDSYNYYRSWPSSLYFSSYASKTFATAGCINAYMVFSLYRGSGSLSIEINYQKMYETDFPISTAGWYQFAIRLPTDKNANVKITGDGYLDDVYVITKP